MILTQEERSRAFWKLNGKCAVLPAPTSGMDFLELDKEIAAVVYGVPPEQITAWKWGVPEFSTDHAWASNVVQEMWAKPDRIRLAFERHLQANIDSYKHKGGIAEALFVCMPHEICYAALAAMAECDLAATGSDAASDPP